MSAVGIHGGAATPAQDPPRVARRPRGAVRKAAAETLPGPQAGRHEQPAEDTLEPPARASSKRGPRPEKPAKSSAKAVVAPPPIVDTGFISRHVADSIWNAVAALVKALPFKEWRPEKYNVVAFQNRVDAARASAQRKATQEINRRQLTLLEHFESPDRILEIVKAALTAAGLEHTGLTAAHPLVTATYVQLRDRMHNRHNFEVPGVLFSMGWDLCVALGLGRRTGKNGMVPGTGSNVAAKLVVGIKEAIQLEIDVALTSGTLRPRVR